MHLQEKQQWEHKFIMSIKQSKSFFNFLLDKHTTKKQIHFVLTNLAHIHLESVTELIYNLLENKFIKISPSLKSGN